MNLSRCHIDPFALQLCPPLLPRKATTDPLFTLRNAEFIRNLQFKRNYYSCTERRTR